MYILSFRGLDDTVSVLAVASVSLLAQVHQCHSSRGTNIICLAPALGAGEEGGARVCSKSPPTEIWYLHLPSPARCWCASLGKCLNVWMLSRVSGGRVNATIKAAGSI